MDSIIQNIGIINLVVLGLNIAVLIILMFICLKFNKSTQRYKKLMKKLSNGVNLEEMILKYISEVEKVSEDNNLLKEQIADIHETLKGCVQKIGVVRYNAFSDTGSDLSFAVVLLDDENTGVVFNGVYSRGISNIYAKQIVKGQSKNNLSEEEKQALNKAINYEKI